MRLIIAVATIWWGPSEPSVFVGVLLTTATGLINLLPSCHQAETWRERESLGPALLHHWRERTRQKGKNDENKGTDP